MRVSGLDLVVGISRAQPKRIREVDRIPTREPVEVEPSGEPDGIGLG
jgi:hypothetical protein